MSSSKTNKILEGLPIRHLIATPFIEAANAQLQLAHATTEFISQTCIDPEGNIRMIEMSYDTESTGGTTKSTIKVPLLTVINVPSLLIQKVSVDFKIEILDIQTDETVKSSSTETEFAANVKASWSGWGAKVECNVKYATKSKMAQTSSSKDEISSKSVYNITVEAEQKMPPGLIKLLDILEKSTNKPPTTTSPTTA
jgi:hypothetical protein